MWYSIENSKKVKMNYNTIIRNSYIILLFHISSSVLFETEEWSIYFYIFYKITFIIIIFY